RLYAADEVNQLGAIMIDSIKAEPVLSRLGQEKVLEIFQARANPELPGDFTPEQIAAASIPADLRKQLVAALAQGAVFTEEQLVGMLGPELGRQTYLAST